MNREEMLACFTEMAEILSRRRVSARVYIVGGAAMALAYDRDRHTPLDGLAAGGCAELTEAVREVARRRGLPDSWLNERASSCIPRGGDARERVVFDHSSLRVAAASPERMLAMKVMSARRADAEDVKPCWESSVSPPPAGLWKPSKPFSPMSRYRNVPGGWWRP